MPRKSNDSSNQPKWFPFSDLMTTASAASRTSSAITPLGKYFHRDLSWLQFNDRVLSEAADDDVPALERLRFAGIVSSNLDEFFMVRVAELSRLAKRAISLRSSRASAQAQILSQIRDHVLLQKSRQASVFRGLLTTLAQNGIVIYTDFSEERELDREIKKQFPPARFIIRRSTEPLPPLASDHIHVFFRFPGEYAIVSLDSRTDRLMQLPPIGKAARYVLLERWLTARASDWFPNRELIESFPFKIIRDADLRYHPDDEETLEEQIVEAVQSRTKARVVRLEVDAASYSEGALYLATSLGLDSASLYRFDIPLDLRTLATLTATNSHQDLKYPPIQPQIPPGFQNQKDIFSTLRKRDYLLHHPYDSFDVVIWFLKEAACDPLVTKIFHTMYRTSKESPVMDALLEAVRNGKQVTVYVEIKARFDELNNVRWAAELRKGGVKVVRPMGGFKVHSKVTQVVREDNGREILYTHLGTGNYHPGTAKQYTDLGLLTSNEKIGQDVSLYFSKLTKRNKEQEFQHLLVAPFNLHNRFEGLINNEMVLHQKHGKGHIIAKMNSLVDLKIIDALYAASKAGVKIDLLVRGICCLRPGIPGLSDNIRVISIVDRFLEHSRIYYFRAGGAKHIYLSSADWMPRNFYSRYEIAFPIFDPVLKKFIRDVVLTNSLADNQKSWMLKADGNYARVPVPPHGKKIRSQLLFEQLAQSHYQGTLLESRLQSLKAMEGRKSSWMERPKDQ